MVAQKKLQAETDRGQQPSEKKLDFVESPEQKSPKEYQSLNIPTHFYDRLMHEYDFDLSQQAAFFYILRRTIGFGKLSDTISYEQFLHGVIKKDGTHLDYGCGIKNRNALCTALTRIEKKGFYRRIRLKNGQYTYTVNTAIFRTIVPEPIPSIVPEAIFNSIPDAVRSIVSVPVHTKEEENPIHRLPIHSLSIEEGHDQDGFDTETSSSSVEPDMYQQVESDSQAPLVVESTLVDTSLVEETTRRGRMMQMAQNIMEDYKTIRKGMYTPCEKDMEAFCAMTKMRGFNRRRLALTIRYWETPEAHKGRKYVVNPQTLAWGQSGRPRFLSIEGAIELVIEREQAEIEEEKDRQSEYEYAVGYLQSVGPRYDGTYGIYYLGANGETIMQTRERGN